jgi:hypothetical protein
MNIEELANKLNNMSDDGVEHFIKALGGNHKTRESVVSYFVSHPEVERRICLLLGLPTEEEKITQSAIDTAKSSKESAEAAKESARAAIDTAKSSNISAESAKKSANTARWGLIISLIAVIISFCFFIINLLNLQK